jgi:hypothetical protein
MIFDVADDRHRPPRIDDIVAVAEFVKVDLLGGVGARVLNLLRTFKAVIGGTFGGLKI